MVEIRRVQLSAADISANDQGRSYQTRQRGREAMYKTVSDALEATSTESTRICSAECGVVCDGPKLRSRRSHGIKVTILVKNALAMMPSC